MVSFDLSRALARFIIPVITIAVIAYVFRLFGFGWRIFRPSHKSRRTIGGESAFDTQLDVIREGDFSGYVERMREEITRKAGDEPEFTRLRREYLQLVSQGSNRRDERVSSEIDRVVVGMIEIYTKVTGKEGISPPVRRIW